MSCNLCPFCKIYFNDLLFNERVQWKVKKIYVILISFCHFKIEKHYYKKFYIFLMCLEKYEVHPSMLFSFVIKHIAVQKRAFSFFISCFFCFKATAIKIHMFLVDFIGSTVVSTATVRLCVHKCKNMAGHFSVLKDVVFCTSVLFCNFFFISGMLNKQTSLENTSLVNFNGKFSG